jgi:4-diphosphocytidyl-2-C-methyl-D-erythritol kinase
VRYNFNFSMDTPLTFKAYAKINLFLEVVGRRPDGYHDLVTVFQTINLCDEIHLNPQKKNISLMCSDATLPVDSKNLAYRAAELLIKESNIQTGVAIYLQKNIPSGAGLGGGSSDAATVLVSCNKLCNLNYSNQQLEKLSAQLGMDVPFFIQGGTALGVDRGETIKKRFKSPALPLVLVYPNLSVSTKKVYETLDSKPIKNIRSVDSMIQAIQKGNAEQIASQLFNRLEEITFALHPEIKELKNLLIKSGCLNAMMSGSGSAVFGICSSANEAHQIAQNIKSSTSYSTFSITTI